MDFEDFDLEDRKRIGLNIRTRFENAMAGNDDKSHAQRLQERLREPEPAAYVARDRTPDTI